MTWALCSNKLSRTRVKSNNLQTVISNRTLTKRRADPLGKPNKKSLPNSPKMMTSRNLSRKRTTLKRKRRTEKRRDEKRRTLKRNPEKNSCTSRSTRRIKTKLWTKNLPQKIPPLKMAKQKLRNVRKGSSKKGKQRIGGAKILKMEAKNWFTEKKKARQNSNLLLQSKS